METRTRVFLPATLLLMVVAGPLVPTVAAGSVSYDFSGTVVSVSPAANAATGVAMGDRISGNFAYDPTQTGSNGFYDFTGSSNVHSFTFTVSDTGGNQVFTDFYSGNVSAYYAISVIYGFTSNPQYPGVNGTELDITGDTVYNQARGFSGPANPGFDFSFFNPGNVGTSPSNPLPDSNVIQNFVNNAAVLAWGQPDQTFTADFNFSVVPEPSSLLLGILAILACTMRFLVRKREPALAS